MAGVHERSEKLVETRVCGGATNTFEAHTLFCSTGPSLLLSTVSPAEPRRLGQLWVSHRNGTVVHEQDVVDIQLE